MSATVLWGSHPSYANGTWIKLMESPSKKELESRKQQGFELAILPPGQEPEPLVMRLLAEALPYIEEGEEFNKASCRTLSKRVREVLRTVYPNGGY